MKKGNKKLLVIAALLLFMAISLTTYALYRGSLTGTATVNTAKFEVEVNGTNVTTQNTTLDLSGLTWTNVAASNVTSGKIAPGANGSANISIENKSEVEITYTVTAVVKDGDTPVSSSIFTVTGSGSTGTVTKGSTATVPVSVQWVSDQDGTVDNPLQNKAYTLEITVVAEQKMA